MKTTDILTMILNELYETRTRLKQAELTALEDQIRKANRIFVAGAGRSLLMIRGFCDAADACWFYGLCRWRYDHPCD